MEKADIVPSRRYGYRSRRTEPLQRVKVLEAVRRARWKVEFLDEPHPGLVDYVRSRELVCRSSDRKTVLRDERWMDALRAEVEREWPGDGPYDTAVMHALAATGERAGTQRGVLSDSPDVIQRLWERVQLPPPTGAPSFVDRHGVMHVGWSDVVAMVHEFASNEPEAVLRQVEREERHLAADGQMPGGAWQLDYLRDLGPRLHSYASGPGSTMSENRRTPRLTEFVDCSGPRFLTFAAPVTNQLPRELRERCVALSSAG